MPRVFDNIERPLVSALQQTLEQSKRADFCVGYFNLRGWRDLSDHVAAWRDTENTCRILIGMQASPHQELREAMRVDQPAGIDQQMALRLKQKLAAQFAEQLMFGVPTNVDEKTLQTLAGQLRAGLVQVKLHMKHRLHAKLYLAFRDDPNNPAVGFVGSSNLTFSGLSGQGELNVDVLDHDACQKLADWFEARWNERFCWDISAELAELIEQSWARETLIPPFHIYLKIAWHLSQEAREGQREFGIPKVFAKQLFPYQSAAVKVAARHLNKRGGVLIGDVVGLGKTLMATALARIFEDDYAIETLILCPKNLVAMWEHHRERYGLRGTVLSVTQVQQRLPDLKRYRLVLIDESHNLRNPEGQRYRVIRDYIYRNQARCILLSATPYNKTYRDLSRNWPCF